MFTISPLAKEESSTMKPDHDREAGLWYFDPSWHVEV